MLEHLHIENYALIRQLELDFSSGFSVITGETGAGKSILLGALGLVLGQRAELNVLFDPQKKCIVEAVFNLKDRDLTEFYKLNEIEDQDQNSIILRREINPQGKSRAFINDSPVSISVLKALGEEIVDIHSQHQSFLIKNPNFQIELLDSLLKDVKPLESYKLLFKDYQIDYKSLASLKEKKKENIAQEDFLQFQYKELSSLALIEGEQEELETSTCSFENIETIKTALDTAEQGIIGDQASVIELLEKIGQQLAKASNFYPLLQDSITRLDSVKIELKDLARDFSHWQEDLELDPEQYRLKLERLDLIYKLESKHRVKDIQSLLKIEKGLELQLNNDANLDNEIQSLEKKLAASQLLLRELGDQIHELRQSAAFVLEEQIGLALAQLGMGSAQFKVDIHKVDDFMSKGQDKLEFLFNANLGGSLQPIEKGASGGELSRLMLAIKSVIHHRSLISCLILDEIDTGVSGEIAGKLGRMMQSMSSYMQLIVITHLPQIAAKAETHFRVSKFEQEGLTLSKVIKLNNQEHIQVLATMLSDDQISPAAIELAKSMIES